MSDVKVAFLTDSCSDIPQELTDKYGIDVIGFHIIPGTQRHNQQPVL